MDLVYIFILIFVVVLLLAIYLCPTVLLGMQALIVRGGAEDFPYKRRDILLEDIERRFHNLQKYRFHLINRPYTIYNMPQLAKDDLIYKPLKKPTLIKLHSDDYENYDLISDYFNESCRMRAKRYDQELTPAEFWEKNCEKVKEYARTKYGEETNYALREAIYEMVAEATSFRPTIMAGFMKHFKAKRVLDISAGWGDRLIGALAGGAEVYCGVDPNPCVHAGYQEIVETLNKNGKTRVELLQSPFETAEVPSLSYDLILTSPPYFNLEVYSDEAGQSTKNYEGMDAWFEKFLMTSLQKAWKLLEKNGHMVIIINDIRNGPKFTERMVQEFNKRTTDAEYLGVISYAEVAGNKVRSPQPCWIWKKY